MNTRATALTTLIAFTQAGCWVIGYGVEPNEAWKVEGPEKTGEPKITYRIRDPQGITFSGRGGLMDSFRKANPFRNASMVPETPSTGVHVDVLADNKPPAAGELVWGYVAMITLFALPAYSGASGFYMKYTVYVDGERTEYYEYEVQRRAFVWLPVIPFAWINLLTKSERDGFTATTRQFFRDAIDDGVFGADTGSPGRDIR